MKKSVGFISGDRNGGLKISDRLIRYTSLPVEEITYLRSPARKVREGKRRTVTGSGEKVHATNFSHRGRGRPPSFCDTESQTVQ